MYLLFIFPVLLLVLFVSIMIGPANLSVLEIIYALLGFGEKSHQLIIWEIRLPRTLLGLCIGATLGISGAALQGLVRNPLASPSLLGASNFAALGAVIAIYFLSASQFPILISLSAILMATCSVVVLMMIAGRDSRVVTLLLSGLALSSLASALIALMLNMAPNPFAIVEITFWLLGSLSDRTLQQFWLALPFMLCCWLILLHERRTLLALTLGEDAAQTLGISLNYAKWRITIAVALGVGAAVAVSGVIGFVGLIVPHLVRPFVQYDPAKLLIPSAFTGGTLLVLSDCAVRLLPTHSELKLGVVTSLIGVPFFLYLVFRERVGRPAFI